MRKKQKPLAEFRAGDTARTAIDRRIANDKSRLIAQLKKNPSIHLAFEKIGVGRRTYYRWRQKDKAFASQVNNAIRDAIALRNDFAESKLLAGIRNGDMRAIKFWLGHHHLAYGAKVKAERQLENNSGLTPEQEKEIRRALRLSGLV
ncbi:MAG: phBC6A51 family helix-turn-helix protein [Candidatus Peribacteraceae bacterium]|nr:phBC6A51 family helix-turn-helix protein [Candidatus Peribacteraceae bacterium]